MNPTSNPVPSQPMPAPTGMPGMNPAPAPARGSGHNALWAILLVIIILGSFGFIGWKWFANQAAIKSLETQNASMQSSIDAEVTEVNEASVSGAIDALDSDMSAIINSSSEEGLKSIDGEF